MSPPPAVPATSDAQLDWLHDGHYWTSVGQRGINATAAQTTLNLWKPFVPSVSDPKQYFLFSLSQMWLNGGGYSGGTGLLQSIEAGAHVYQDLYNEVRKSHFFIYWTADEYGDTGCHNLDCPGFVVTSNILPIGGALAVSRTGGTQVEGTIAWHRDPATGNWVLFGHDAANGYQQVGYLPKRLFRDGQLSRSATTVSFGGEVYTPPQDAPTHQMGSGANPLKFTGTLYGNVAYQRGMKWADAANVVHDLQPAEIGMTPMGNGCAYGARFYPSYAPYRSGWGSAMFFGGNGFGAGCARQ